MMFGEILLLSIILWIGFGFLDILFHGNFMHRTQRNGWCAVLAATYQVVVAPESWWVSIISYLCIFVFVDVVGFYLTAKD